MIRINLLSVKETEQALGRRQQRAMAILGVLVLALCMIVPFMMQRGRLATLNRDVDEVQRDVTRFNQQVKEVEDLAKLKDEYTAKLQVIRDLHDKRVGPARVLADLSAAVPEKLWVTDFNEVGGGVTILGVALDNETVANFMRQLAASPYFVNVDLDESRNLADVKGGAARGGATPVDFKRFVVKARIDYFGRGGKPAVPAAGGDSKKPATPAATTPGAGSVEQAK